MREERQINSNIFCKALCFYFICLPLGVVTTSVGSVLKIIALLPIGVFVLQFLRYPKIIMSKKELFYALFCLWMLLTMPFTVDFENTKAGIVGHFSFLLLLVSAAYYSYSEKQIHNFKLSMVWSSRITAMLTLGIAAYEEGRLVLSGVFNEDPNYLCAYFLFGILYGIGVIFENDSPLWKRILSVVELLVYFYIILSTGSRGGMLAVFITVISAVIIKRKRSSTNILRDVLIITFIFIIGSIAISYIPELILDRFTIASIRSSGGTGRFQLWSWAWNIFIDSPFWRQIVGYGTFTMQDVYLSYGFYRQVAHNVFLQFLVENGVVGVLLYTSSIICFVKESLKRNDVFYFAIMMGMIAMSLSMSIVVFKPYWNIMIAITCLSSCRPVSRQVRNFVLNKS